jgi:hypothetical protein
MSIKFPLTVLTIAGLLTAFNPAIASAETYKTNKNQVVITGLKAKHKYAIDVINAKGKARKRQLTTNTCGQLLIDNAVKYQSLAVEGKTIDPSTLKTQTHQRCKAKKINTAKSPKSQTTQPNPTVTVTPVPIPGATPTKSP